MPRLSRSSKPRITPTEEEAIGLDLTILEEAMAVEVLDDECPSCLRGRIVDNRCNRCGVMIPSSGTLKDYAWSSRRSE
jgi:hypothetical protein